MAIVQDWKIRAAQAVCHETGRSFVDGEVFLTCLFEDSDSDGFVRRDYSLKAWESVQSSLAPAPYSFWKSTFRVPEPVETTKLSVTETPIEDLLRRFIEEDSPATEKARYILVLMLERGKILRQVDSRSIGERNLIFYEHSKTGDVFIVTDPGLKLSEVEDVQREVIELISEGDRKSSTESARQGVMEPSESDPSDDKEQSQQEGDQATETEDQAVTHSGEETTDAVRSDPNI